MFFSLEIFNGNVRISKKSHTLESHDKKIYYSNFSIISKKNCIKSIEDEILYFGAKIKSLKDIPAFSQLDINDTYTAKLEDFESLINPFVTKLKLDDF